MDADVEEVIASERRLLDPRVRRDAAAVRSLLHDDFREFGASGAVWDRQSIVLATSGDPTGGVAMQEIRTVRLGPDTIMLTYTAQRARKASLRTSIWMRSGADWLLLHHQGTPSG